MRTAKPEADESEEKGWMKMRALIQRVSQASVVCDDGYQSSIGHGFLILLGVGELAKRDFPVVETGSFGAEMQVSLTNEGPFTLWLDTDQF